LDEDYEPDFKTDRKAARLWAKELLSQPDTWVILDTETTGLDIYFDEIVQIALLAPDGQTLFESYVKPSKPISNRAKAVHGISNEIVRGAPTFAEIYSRLIELIQGKKLVIYNAGFDWNFLVRQSDEAGLDYFPFDKPICAMEMYSQYIGEWNYYHGNYKWQKLPGGDHSALGDARATLKIIQKMADKA
jgi:DNA polymerase-3 subunit epsilon